MIQRAKTSGSSHNLTLITNEDENLAKRLLNKELISFKDVDGGSFHQLYNKKPKDTYEIFRNGGFSLSEWESHQKQWNLDINIDEYKYFVKELQSNTLEIIKRENKKDYVGIVNVPAYLDDKPKHMINYRKDRKIKKDFIVNLEIGANCGFKASEIAQASLGAMEVLDLLFLQDKNYKLSKNIMVSGRESGETIVKLTNVKNNNFFNNIHQLLPMNLRGLHFSIKHNLHKLVDTEEGIWDCGMGQPISNDLNTFNTQDTFLKKARISSNKEAVSLLKSKKGIIITTAGITNNYNCLRTKEDVKDFITDFKIFMKEVENE